MSDIDMSKQEHATLYYCHDPMCSYCYAFEGTWAQLRGMLGTNIDVKYLVGGLACDSDEAMTDEMQDKLQEVWRHIESSFNKPFNFDFWTLQQPRRATYDACRAALLARAQGVEQAMIDVIQQAYYLNAKNPSELNILADCAQQIGMNRDEFLVHMVDSDTNDLLRVDVRLARQLSMNSFPSLLLERGGSYTPIAIDYMDASAMLGAISSALS